MNIQLLKNLLIRHEGKINKVYADTLGLKTAGIGHLLLGADRDMAIGTAVTEEQVQKWFDADVARSTLLAKQIVASFPLLSDTRQMVIIDLCFNMGNRLGGFHRFLDAMGNQDYAEAAAELKDSKWYKQVGRRGPELCNAMLNDRFDFAL